MAEQTSVSPFPMEIGRVPKNKKESYIIALNEYAGKIYIDVRLHALIDSGPESIPTKKGITLNMRNFEPMVKLMLEAYKALEEVMKNPAINKNLDVSSD